MLRLFCFKRRWQARQRERRKGWSEKVLNTESEWKGVFKAFIRWPWQRRVKKVMAKSLHKGGLWIEAPGLGMQTGYAKSTAGPGAEAWVPEAWVPDYNSSTPCTVPGAGRAVPLGGLPGEAFVTACDRAWQDCAGAGLLSYRLHFRDFLTLTGFWGNQHNMAFDNLIVKGYNQNDRRTHKCEGSF